MKRQMLIRGLGADFPKVRNVVSDKVAWSKGIEWAQPGSAQGLGGLNVG